MLRTKYLIIGAGVTGLCFANFIKDNRYIILEKEDEPGGLCRTIYKGDYVWDYSGHFFHFFSAELKKFFETKLSSSDLIKCKKCTKIFYKGNYIDFPFQKNIHQLPKDEFIECLYDLFFRRESTSYSSFEKMLYGKFGVGITEKFLKPYNEKLYACDLNTLDENAMGRFFPYASIEEIIKNMKRDETIAGNSYNEYFFYPKKGATVFVNALSTAIPKSKLFLGSELLRIDLERHIATTTKGTIEYQYLINTIPLSNLLKICSPNPITGDMEVLESNKVLVFNLGFDKKSKFDDIHWIYFPDKKINFYRVGFYDNILDTPKLSLYVELGYSSEAAINEEVELESTLKNLQSIGIIDDHHLIDYTSVVMNPAYVHISEKSQQLVHKTKDFLAKYHVYTAGRYGNWTYCSIEDSLTDAINLTKILRK